MNDQAATSTGEVRREPAPSRADRALLWLLRVVSYGAAAICLAVVWFSHLILALSGGPDVSPIAYGIAATIGTAILAACVLRRKSSVPRLLTFVALAGLYLALLARTGTLEDEPRVMHFHAAYRAIQPGMSPEEAQAAVDAHASDRRWKIRTSGGVCFVGPLDPDDWRYNAEFFQLNFRDGVVASKRYLPD